MKLIKKNGLLGIDKKEVDKLIAAKKFVGLNKKPRSEKIIVSLTSYKPRINDVKYTIYSLLIQSCPPDRLILWLDEDSFPQREKNLPQDLLELRDFGLTIDWCENLRSYKKLIPALKKFPDDIIVTADDDIFYRPNWLKILYEEHLKYSDCVIAHRAHRVRLDTRGNLFPYHLWHFEIKVFNTPPSRSVMAISSRARAEYFTQRNFPTSGAGALFKKNFFHDDVLRRDLFTELAPLADDIWFWAMTVLNDTKIKIPDAAQSNLIYVDIDTQTNGETLFSKNIGEGKNDVQLRRIIEYYPTLLEKLIRESAEFKPYLSVVLPVKNSKDLPACLKNIFAQKFPDFELILVNCGSRVKLSPLPTNFHVINYPGGSFVDALNLGLRKAAGEYILFKNENSILPRSALDIVAQFANNFAADVIHFSGHVQIKGDSRQLVLDDASDLKQDTTKFLDAPKQIRGELWLQGKLSKRLDTKIFRREFLTRHALNFVDDLSEFLFGALIQAEKYLLVPQAFCFSKE